MIQMLAVSGSLSASGAGCPNVCGVASSPWPPCYSAVTLPASRRGPPLPASGFPVSFQGLPAQNQLQGSPENTVFRRLPWGGEEAEQPSVCCEATGCAWPRLWVLRQAFLVLPDQSRSRSAPSQNSLHRNPHRSSCSLSCITFICIHICSSCYKLLEGKAYVGFAL